MAQQTAVEWLVNELISKSEYEHLPNSYFLMSDKDIDKIIIQAKAMEKEQIMKAVDRGFDEGCKFPEDISLNNAEQYYNENYSK